MIERVRRRVNFALEQWFNHFLDRSFGIHTDFIRNPIETDKNRDAIAHAKRYHASNYWAATKAIWYVHRRFGHHTLIDLGCGAGRILVLGDFLGFRKLIGVEIDRELIDQAEDNFRRAKRRFGSRSVLELYEQSAGSFEMPSSGCVVFLFNPFDRHIFDQFLELNRKALFEESVSFVCINPSFHESLVKIGFQVVREWRHVDFSRAVHIYRLVR